ncbi:hypothetical protein [Amphritea sp.]|uniref:hypothetical protein n=1 Tax=Amphritea sp. TaxID=1872502 RepID=UPI003A8F4BC2
MKRLLIGLSSALLLVVIGGAYAGDDKQAMQVEPPKVKVTEEKLRREATREAIRRAVRGDVTDAAVFEKRYESISHEEVDQYIGCWVKLETYFGRKVEGVLRRVKGDTLYIDEYVERGNATYPINKTKLSRLKVLR